MTTSAWLSPYCGSPPPVFSILTRYTGLFGGRSCRRPVSGDTLVSTAGVADSPVPGLSSVRDEQEARTSPRQVQATAVRNLIPEGCPTSRAQTVRLAGWMPATTL